MFRLITKNLHGKFCYLPSRIPSMLVEECNSVTRINSYLKSDMFNVVFADGCHTNVDVINVFLKERLPFAWWVDDRDSKLKKTLESSGLVCVEEETAMAINLQNISAKKHENLTIKKVTAQDDLEAWIEVFGALLPKEKYAIESFYQKAQDYILNGSTSMVFFVGFLDKPVATCSLYFEQGIAGIYDLITIPEAQRKGIATAMMYHAMTYSQKAGFSHVTLGASNEGKGLYEKVGFQAYGKYKVYSSVAS